MLSILPLLLAAVAFSPLSSAYHAHLAPRFETSHSKQAIKDHTRTTIAFPAGGDWWTLGKDKGDVVNVIEWWWSGLTADAIRIVIGNVDKEQLGWGAVLVDKVEARMLSVALDELDPAVTPGSGYFLQLRDHRDRDIIYATSQLFDILPPGSAPIDNPLPYGFLNPRNLSSDATANRASFATLPVAAAVSVLLLV